MANFSFSCAFNHPQVCGFFGSETEAEESHFIAQQCDGLAVAKFYCEVLSSRLSLKFLLKEKNHLHPLFLNTGGFGG